MLDDKQRAAIAILAGNVISAFVLFNFVDWGADQVAILNAIVSSVLIAAGLFIPAKHKDVT